MGLLVKLFQKKPERQFMQEVATPDYMTWLQASPDQMAVSKRYSERRRIEAYLYDEEEQALLRDINLSLIIIKMAFGLAEDKKLANSIVSRNLQPFVILDTDIPRREYLQKLSIVARSESSIFAKKLGFESFEALGRRWQRSGKDLYERTNGLGPLGEQIESKQQHILRKYAKQSKVPYLTVVTRLPQEPTRIEIPRFQVERPYIAGSIPCASFEEAKSIAQQLAPAIAKDEKEGMIEHFTSFYFD